jgi:hypothetical protein
MEAINQCYLFKIKRSNNVKKLIYRHHCLGEWIYINKEWEAKEDVLQWQGWEKIAGLLWYVDGYQVIISWY